MIVTQRPLTEDSPTHQNARRLAPRLAVYLPHALTRRILNEGKLIPGQARTLQAATLFCDISGFTAMSEALAEDGPRGAEELNRSLLMTFTPMINAIHTAGGSVCHFHGDAMLVYFVDDDGRAAMRSLACARFLQSLMLTRTQVEANRQTGQKATFALTIKIGVGYGRCLEMVVGEMNNSLEFVLAGTAVDDAVAAENQAQAGQLIASRTALQKAGWPADAPFREVTEIAPVPSANPSIYWDAFPPEHIHQLAEIAAAFMHPNLYGRLQDENTQFVAEHRSVTSLFVQFEGIDYETADAAQKLQEYYHWAREIVSRYGGENSRLNRLLTGDKGSQLHILFGAPVAPDAPDMALRCALALQREKPGFINQQRIGVASGRAFACALGSQNRREYTAVGRVVNLSARLALICAAGEVLTDKATAQRVHDTIEFEVLSPVAVKGFQRPITPHKAIGEQSTSMHLSARFDRWQKPPPGRDQELWLLLEKMDESLKGKGHFVALTGEMGSGQSQLLAVAVRYWLEAGGTGFMGMGQLQESDVAFAPWRSVWRDFFGLLPDMSTATQMLSVADRLQTLNIHCTDEQLQIWGDILGLTEQMGQPLSEATLAQFFGLAQNHLYQAATRNPILIVIEDLHLADQFSLDLLDQIAQKLRKRRLLILVTYRPQPDFSFRTLHRSICTPIVLEDLAPDRARAVVKQIVGTDDLPVIVQQRLGMRDRNGRSSPVNPLFLVESLKLMMTQGILNTAENGRVKLDTGQLERLQVPDNVYAISLTQLDHLSASSRSLLQAASVIGREFDLLTLTAVVPSADTTILQQYLEELQASGMIQLVAEEPHPTYMFQRALTHNAVYQSLPFARRQSLHALIADGLIARHRDNLPPIYPILAYHYGQSDRHEDGLHYAVLAAKEAENLHANKEAAELYELAQRHILVLGEANYWQQAIYVYNNRARVLHMAGQFKQAITAAADALKLALVHGSSTDSQPIYNMLAEIRYGQARYTDVQALTTNVTKNPAGCEPRILIRAYTLAGLAANGLFDYEAAQMALQQAHEIALTADNAYELVYVLGTQALLHYEHGRLDVAYKTGQEAVELARQENVPVQLALSLSALCQIQVRRGKPEEALTAVNEAIHLIQPLSRNLWARFLVQRTAVLLYLGRLPAAYTDLQDATRLLQEMEDPHSLLQAYLLGLELHQTRDDWQEARKWLAQAGEVMAAQKAENAAYMTEQLRLWLATGQMALHFQHPEQAESHFHLAMRAVQARHLSWWRPAVLYWLAMLKVGLQNNNRAVHYLEAALNAVKRGGDPDMLPLILLQMALLEEDNGRRAQYLTASINAANVRARYRDRITCFRTAAPLLTASEEPQLRQIGQRCQKLVAWFDAEVES